MKKIVLFTVIVVTLVSILSMTAFAHCGRGGGRAAAQRQPAYELCPVDGCALLGAHQHDGSYYCGGAGLNYYEVCPVTGCTLPGLHEHDGSYYHCAVHYTGRGCGRGWGR